MQETNCVEAQMKNRKWIIGSLAAFASEVLYGLSPLFTKQATDHASVLSLLGWRFLLAFVVMSALAATGILKIHLKGKNLKPLLLVALFSPVIYFIGETFGIHNTTASESGVFLACIPVASLIASATLLHKKPTRLQIIGISITLVGVVITVLSVGASSSFSVVGYAFLLVSVVSYALYCVFADKAGDYSELEITYVMLAAGATVFVALALADALISGNMSLLLTLPFKDSSFLSAILYQGIGCSILGFFLFNVAIAKIGVNQTSSYIGVGTVVSVAAGALLLNEPFTVFQIIGAVVIIIGVYTANAKPEENN